MKLRDLLVGTEVLALSEHSDIEVTSVAYDSRKVGPGGLFVAICGEQTDGNRFVADAIERGAACIVSEHAAPADLPPPVAWAQVQQARRALATIGANFHGRPAETVKLVGITGTNGKTTTAYLVDSVLRAAGLTTGLLGTVGHRTPRGEQKAKHTTPESLDLQRFFAEVREAGGTHIALEVSSHALAMDRVWGCRFAVAVFTNLTRDHLDFHQTLPEYFASKRRLFEGTGAGVPAIGVVNTDDPHGKELVGRAKRTLTFGLESAADVTTKKFTLSFSGLEFTAQTPAGKATIRSPLVGRPNVYNLLATVAVGLALDIPLPDIEAGLHQLQSVPGRFERIDEGQPYLVVVDYAHTDDALRSLIQTARELNKGGRVIIVFGCGGDRDRTKRPLMGEVAGSLSHLVVLTSDNPRTEDPLRIINDIVVGLQKAHGNYVIELDRERAIDRALDEAQPGDIVLLAGKGHETYQILRDRTLDFDDREMARQALRRRGFGK